MSLRRFIYLFDTINYKMNQRQKQLGTKVMQNLLSIGLLAIGSVITFFTYDISHLLKITNSFVVIFSGLFLILGGAGTGMYLMFRRTLLAEDATRPSSLTIVATLCWVFSAISLLLLFFYPSFYGFDLEILFNSLKAIFGWGIAGIVLTIIELTRTLKSKY